MTAWRFSLAPFGEPGTVMMTVLFLTPATGLDIIATLWWCQLGRRDSGSTKTSDSQGVTLSEAASMPWTRPGACLCMSGPMACEC